MFYQGLVPALSQLGLQKDQGKKLEWKLFFEKKETSKFKDGLD